MSYQNKIKKQLVIYKESNLEKLDDGLWKRHNKFYGHILPLEKWFYNLLPEYRSEIQNYILEKKIKKHIYFHHLNSSQALCLNFFYPLFIERKLELILPKLDIFNDSIDYNSVCFEKNSKLEKGYRPTSFDFYFRTSNGKSVYFEIKYTETEFGKAKKDKIHIDKYESVYKDNCISINSEYKSCDSFLNNYQLMRNIIHVSNDALVVFLYPVDNKKISSQVKYAESSLVKSDLQKNVRNLTWESLLKALNSIDLEDSKLSSQLSDLIKKYDFKV